MSIFVGDDGLDVTIGECGLVNAEIRSDILGKYKPLLGVFPVFPGAKVAQMILVGTLELVTFYVIWFLERSGRNRGCIQGILLKKSQTPSSSECPWLSSAGSLFVAYAGEGIVRQTLDARADIWKNTCR